MLETDLKNEINQHLTNWGRWCSGGWPPLTYSQLPTSRDYRPTDQREKTHRAYDIDVPDAEAANHAICNLAVAGNTRSYQIIAAWWAHHTPARVIAKQLHCSLASVYNYRLYAMYAFWPEYVREIEKNRKRKNILTGLEKTPRIPWLNY